MFRASHLRPERRLHAVLLGLVVLLVATAWLVLWTWHGSPYAGYLHHDVPAGLGAGAEIALFVVGWTVMIVAMMLPTTAPLLVTFVTLVRRRHRPGVLVGILIGGYILVWSAFGLAAWLADRIVHAAVEAVPVLSANPAILLAATLVVAGAYQFSALKERCLSECQSPLGFVLTRWTGVASRRDALRIGISHGAFCVGCCWSLMLVMFAVGVGSFAWMLVLGAVMAVEKNLPLGRRLVRPTGVLLLLSALLVLNGW